MIVWSPKAPTAVLDYTFDLSDALQENEAIAGFVIAPQGVNVNSSAVEGENVRVWLAGGTQGTIAKVNLTVTTTSQRTIPEVAVLEIGGGPLGFEEAKDYLRMGDDNSRDMEIAAHLQGAVSYVEAVTDKCLTPKVITDNLPGLWNGHLFKGPVREIVRVEYDPLDGGVPVELTDYRVRNNRLYLWGNSSPLLTAAVRVTYVAGYEIGHCPPALLVALKLLVGHYFANTEAVSDRQSNEVPLGVKAHLRPFITRTV